MLGIRLDAETERGLEAIARQSRRPKSQIAREAIRSYVLRHDVDGTARAQWKAISAAERDDPALAAMLDGMASEIGGEV